MDLLDYLKGIAIENLSVFDARFHRTGGGFHFEVELDNLAHPLGAVSLDECIQMNHQLVADMDRLITEAGDALSVEIPEGLTVENYTLEVSSAGAERKLRLPGELERFKGSPIRIRVRNSEGGLTQKIVTYTGTSGENESLLYYEFAVYQPRRGRGKKGRNKKEHGKAEKIGSPVTKDGILSIPAADLVEARLYLDF